MARRIQLDDSRKNRTQAEAAIRAKQEAQAFELGIPLCPEYLWNNRPLYEIWRKSSARLLKERLLAFSDQKPLMEICEAQLAGNTQAFERIFQATWGSRERFPEQDSPNGHTLAGFIKRVRDERQGFEFRLRPKQTVCLDAAHKEYAWPEGDASTLARAYAQSVIDGGVPSCELMVRAASRFLNDLETGWQEGFYWDPLAARNVVTFAKEFCGLDNIMPWQTWVLTNLFAWKRASGYRRFQEAWLSVGRKCGKTKFASVVALFLLVADQERYPEIYAAATARDQSRIVWRDARRTVGDYPELASHIQRWAGELAVKETDGRFLPLASEERSFLGVRAHGIVADEVGVWSDRLAWDTLIQSTVSRCQPMTLAITTAPAHRQTFCYEKFGYVEKVLRGIVKADHIFAAIYTLDKDDSYKDIAALRKANPSLGVTLLEEHLVKQIAELEESPSGLNNFLRFHANVTPEETLTRQGSIAASKWDACTGFDLIGETDPLKATHKFMALNLSTPVYLGIDIGLSSDLTAVAMFWPKARFTEGGELLARPTVVVQTFIPELGLLEKERQWSVPLSAWVRSSFLETLPGDMTDVREIAKYVREVWSKFNVREAGFDPWQFPTSAAELNEAGYTCVAVPQLPSQLTAPCRELAAAINRGEFCHFGNPLLTWNAANVVWEESERHGGCKPAKLNPPHGKVDGISATVNAIHRALANPVTGSPRMWLLGDQGSVEVSNADGKFEAVLPRKEKDNGQNH